MACACQGRGATTKYVWTSATDPNDIVVYDTEIQAKAKVLRAGGSYVAQG